LDWHSYINQLPPYPELKSVVEKEVASTIVDTIRAPIKRVLEVGCSNGRWLRWFRRQYGCEVHGVDLDKVGFSTGDTGFVLADGFNLPYENGVFDLVFSFGLVEHFKPKDRFSLLGEQVRTLRKKGYLICEVPKVYRNLEPFRARVLKQQGHYAVNMQEMVAAFKSLGVNVSACKSIGWLFDFRLPKFSDLSILKNHFITIGILND